MRSAVAIPALVAALVVLAPSSAAAGSGGSSDSAETYEVGDLGLHMYANLGETWGRDPTSSRVDGARFLAIFPLGVDLYLGPRWRLGLAGESLVGFIVPSLIGELSLDYAPLGMGSHGPLFHAGLRGVLVSPGRICTNRAAACQDARDRLRDAYEGRPDWIGPVLSGGLGTIGAGYQLSFTRWQLYGMVAYQGGYLAPPSGGVDTSVSALATYYQGYLATLGVHIVYH